MLRALAVLFLLSSMAHAIVIGPTVYEQDDFGDPVLLQDFTYVLSADCTAGTITTIAMDGKNRPVEGAQTYLKYVDFSTPLISRGLTDREGVKLHKLPGSPMLMRGMFVLLIEKAGFRSKEVHFDISGCYSNGTASAGNRTGGTGNGNHGTGNNGSVQPAPGQANASSPGAANWTVQNATNGTGNGTNETGGGLPETERGLLEGPACPAALLGFMGLGIALISIFVYNIITAKRQV